MGEGNYSDQIAKLQDAKVAIRQLADMKSEKEQLEATDKKLNKKLSSLEKDCSNAISSTIKKRRDAVSGEFDKDISAGTDKLKKAKSKKDKAKNIGIKDRIEHDTAILRSENEGIKRTMKKVFYDSHTPGICRSALFYALYKPTTVSEALSGVLIMLFLMIGIPSLLILCLSITEIWKIILMFAGFIIVFGGIYVLGFIFLRERNHEAIMEGASMKKDIAKNNKKIQKITRAIKKDKDEGQYRLEDYDYEIGVCENELEELNKKKAEALSTFEEVTSKMITDEITEQYRPDIESTQKEVEDNAEILKAKTEQYKNHDQYVYSNFESVIGKDYMTEAKLDLLIKAMSDGNASTIPDAILFVKNNKN